MTMLGPGTSMYSSVLNVLISYLLRLNHFNIISN